MDLNDLHDNDILLIIGFQHVTMFLYFIRLLKCH